MIALDLVSRNAAVAILCAHEDQTRGDNSDQSNGCRQRCPMIYPRNGYGTAALTKGGSLFCIETIVMEHRAALLRCERTMLKRDCALTMAIGR